MKHLYVNKERANKIILLRGPLNGRYEGGSFFIIEESPNILENSVYMAELHTLEHIEEHISPHQLKQFATLPNCQLCFREEFTTSIEPTIEGIKKLILQYGIEARNIWVTVSFTHEKYKLDQILSNTSIFGVNIQVHNFYLNVVYEQYLGNINYFEQLKTPIEQKRFSVFSRRYDNARFYFFSKLVTENLINDCCYTFTNFIPELRPYPDPWVTKHELQEDEIVKEYTDKKLILLRQWIDGLPYCLDTTDLRNSFPLTIYDLYAKGKINIVIETRYKKNRIMVTEKTYKAIVSQKPFLMIAPVSSMQLLKEEGFKSFSDLFDERYDEVDDHKTKVKMIVSEMKRLHSLSNTEFNRKIHELDNLVKFNFRKFIALGKLTSNCTILQDLDLV